MEDTSVPVLAATTGRHPELIRPTKESKGKRARSIPIHIDGPSSNRLADSSPARLDARNSDRFSPSCRAKRGSGTARASAGRRASPPTRQTACGLLNEFHPA